MRSKSGAARNQSKKRIFQPVKGFRRRPSPPAEIGQGDPAPGRDVRVPRPPGPQARVPQALHHPAQRRRRDAGPPLQPVDPWAPPGPDRPGPQEPLRAGDPRSRDVRRDRLQGPRASSTSTTRTSTPARRPRRPEPASTDPESTPRRIGRRDLRWTSGANAREGRCPNGPTIDQVSHRRTTAPDSISQPHELDRLRSPTPWPISMRCWPPGWPRSGKRPRPRRSRRRGSSSSARSRAGSRPRRSGSSRSSRRRGRSTASGSTPSRRELEAALEAAKVARRTQGRPSRRGSTSPCPGIRPRLGHRHPLTQTADELIDLFGRFGFAVARGPEVEDVRHNFDALNIPPSHPARDPLDNFYLAASEKTDRAGPPAAAVRCSAARRARCRSG